MGGRKKQSRIRKTPTVCPPAGLQHGPSGGLLMALFACQHRDRYDHLSIVSFNVHMRLAALLILSP